MDAPIIRGSGGGKSGGEGGRSAKEDKDTLISKSFARVVDLLCEGEIEGFANADRPLASIYLDGTPIENDDTVTHTDGHFTQGSTEFTSASATFTKSHEGRYLIAAGFVPRYTSIITFVDAHTVKLSSQATATSTAATFTVGGSRNWKNFNYRYVPGSVNQTALPNFNASEDVTSVGQRIRKGWPTEAWTSPTFTDETLDAIIIGLRLPRLQKQDMQTGDVHGTKVQIRIWSKQGSGGWTTEKEDTISGKTTSGYVRDYRLEVSDWERPFQVAVERVTNNSDSQALQDETWLEYYTEITYGKLTHPNSVCVASRFEASQFTSIPRRGYHMKGLRCKVPSNYDPVSRTYDGDWNGTFQIKYHNNPAWCWFAMATNRRFGLGNLVNANLDLDKWALYEIGKYCDVMVPDGFGSTEPRFTCNLYLQEPNDAWKVLSDMIGICRGMIAYYNGVITPVQDSPAPTGSYRMFSPTNVIDGRFSYSGTSLKARHNAVQVSWNDLTDQGELKYEYVEDSQSIAETGSLNLLKIGGFGCSSRGQARRWALGALWMEKLLTDTVTFQTALEGFFIIPGQIGSIQDPFRAGVDVSGRLKSGSTNLLLKLDKPVTIEQNRTYLAQVIKPSDGSMAVAHVSQPAGQNLTELQLDQFNTFPFTPEAESVWQLAVIGYLDPQLYRLIAVSPVQDNIVEVTGLQYNESLYDFIDFNEDLDIPPTSILPGLDVVKKPGALTFNEEWRLNEEGKWRCNLDVSWVQSTDRFLSSYICAWRVNDGNWHYAPQTVDNSIAILNVRSGQEYDVSVVAVNTIGRKSDPRAGTHVIRAAPPPPPQPPNPPPAGQCYPPQFIPPAGQYITQEFPLTVQLYSGTLDAWMRYTLDGSTPTINHGIQIQENIAQITIQAGQTLKALAYMQDGSLSPSTITSGLYRAITPPLPQIVGLEIIGQGNNVVFRDENVTFTWRGVIAGYFTEGPFDENEATEGPRITSYRVRIKVSGVVIYSGTVSDPIYTLTGAANWTYMKAAFGENAWLAPRLTVAVTARDDLGRYGTEVSLDVRNPAPAIPAAPYSLATGQMQIYASWGYSNTGDTDIWLVGAFISLNPNDEHPVLAAYAVYPATGLNFHVATEDIYHVWLRTVDWFNQTSPMRYLGSVQPGHIAPVNFDPLDGAVIPSGQAITLWSWDTPNGAVIYYTLAAGGNGGWQVYNPSSRPVISGSGSFRMYAQARMGAFASDITMATWTIGANTCAMPTLDPPTGTYNEDGSLPAGMYVWAATATAGAQMWFTLDGTNPVPNGNGYSIPGTWGALRVPVGATTVVKILAYKAGMTNSPIYPAAYTILHSDGMSICAKPTFLPPEGTLEAYPYPIQLNCDTPNASIIYTLDGTPPTHNNGIVVPSGTWITVRLNNWLAAFATRTGWADSDLAIQRYTLATACNPPHFIPVAGDYSTFPQTVVIYTSTLSAYMRWTNDGTTPTAGANGHGTLISSYQGSIQVQANQTIRVIAYKPTGGLPPSQVSTGYFHQVTKVATPTFNPPAGQYNANEYPKNITLNCTTTGAELHYTKDGSTPNQNSPFVSPGQVVSVMAGQTLKVIGYKSGMEQSTMASAAYTVLGACADPTFNPEGGAFNITTVNVILNCATSGASISYTVDNSTPTPTHGTIVSAGTQIGLWIPLAGVTLKAMAFKTGNTNSQIHSAFFERDTANM